MATRPLWWCHGPHLCETKLWTCCRRYVADSISCLESGVSEESAFDDSVTVLDIRTYTVRELDVANNVGGPTVRVINRNANLSAQAENGYCSESIKALNAGKIISFSSNHDGILLRSAAPDGAHEGVLPGFLHEQVHHIEHDLTLASHLGEARMYAAMWKNYCWVGIPDDVVSYERKFESCARQRVRPLARRSFLTLVLAKTPFQDIAVDLYGPRDRTAAGHRFILVITNRKLVGSILMDETTAADCASVVPDYCVAAFVPPDQLLKRVRDQFPGISCRCVSGVIARTYLELLVLLCRIIGQLPITGSHVRHNRKGLRLDCAAEGGRASRRFRGCPAMAGAVLVKCQQGTDDEDASEVTGAPSVA